MSRPATRSKNKRHKPEDDNGNTSEILRHIHVVGNITPDDIHQLYMITKPICQGCRQNSKDNPNCFCGLVPPPNGTRKSGLWQKTSDIILTLGPDPAKELRDSTSWPAGLTNLGATCYANCILQCLYMNTSFRAGVFSVEPDLFTKHPVLDQLARLFSQLHSSRRTFIDSAPFIKTLELDNGVQQDSHEFFTLLLSLLQRSLHQSKVSKARSIIQDLFRGSVSHVTRCSNCGRESPASSKMEDFYELELNIKGLKNLYQSLEDYLSIEELSGDNQYYCELCGARVDATRCIKLRTLPDILNFQLRRCVFIPKTTTKKKLTSVFSFPLELDMAQRLCEPSNSEFIYDLSAVLIHKGTTVNSGHYVANIKDEHTGQWWEFDDEHVSQLGTHPFGEVPVNLAAKPMENESDVQPSTAKKIDSVSNGNDQLRFYELKTPRQSESFSSADAYMLMYRRKTKTEHGHLPGMDIEKYQNLVCEGGDGSLPFHLSEEIKELNASYMKASQNYKLKKERELENIIQRRQEVRSILSEAPVRSLEEQYFWIATEWLRQWADNINPPAIDNTPIQCSHGHVHFSNIGSMKRLSAKAWTSLLSKFGGGPVLANEDNCIDCLIDETRFMIRTESYRDQRAVLKEDAEAALAGKFLDGTLYYVSRPWLLQWIRKKNVDFTSEADIGPTASIKCTHGELLPEVAAGAKRVLVPEKLWIFLSETSNALRPDDPLGCPAFPLDTEPCAICSVELSEVACLEDSLRAAKLKQRQNHEKLFSGKSIPLSPGCKYYLLPSSWVTKWRSYITTSGKNASSSVEPDRLDVVVDSVICEKHSRLLERPPNLIRKRGIIIQRTSPATATGLTVITDKDWQFFCEEWAGTEQKGISAQIELSACGTNGSVGSSEEMPISGCLSPSNDESNDELELRQPFIRTHPEICEECIGERESCELMQKLNYCNEDIAVVLVRGKEVPRSILEASGTVSETDRRSSKRSRKTSYGNSINLKVSSSTSIYQLKMLIWESFGVVKENQILHKGSKIIDEESATLADVNIFPGDRLWVKDSEIHEHRDIADELSGQKMEVESTEIGFRGTLLTSNISAQ